MSNLSAALEARRNRQPDGERTGIQPAAPVGMDRRIRPPRLTPMRLLAVLAGVAVVSAVVYGYTRFALQSTLTVNGQRLVVSTVESALFHDYIPVTGNVVPGTSVYLDAVDGGRITHVYVDEGARVTAGQPLVALENTALQLEVIGREAQLTEQINNASVTRLSFDQNRLARRQALIDVDYRIDTLSRRLVRLEQLSEAGAATRERLDEVRAERDYRRALKAVLLESQRVEELAQAKQLETLQAAVDALERNMGIARANLDNLTLRAPIDGQLTSLEANVGESKAPGQRIGKIDDVDSFKVSALVDEFYLGRVRLGQAAAADVDGVRHELTVDKIYPEVRDRQFRIDLAFDGLPDAVRRGQTLSLRLEIGASVRTLTVDDGPFYDESGGGWVYVLDDSGRSATRRSVRFGRRTPDQVEVLAGLDEGERVITSGYRRFNDAQTLLLDESGN